MSGTSDWKMEGAVTVLVTGNGKQNPRLYDDDDVFTDI
jgi:hypothetical protein